MPFSFGISLLCLNGPKDDKIGANLWKYAAFKALTINATHQYFEENY